MAHACALSPHASKIALQVPFCLALNSRELCLSPLRIYCRC